MTQAFLSSIFLLPVLALALIAIWGLVDLVRYMYRSGFPGAAAFFVVFAILSGLIAVACVVIMFNTWSVYV